MEIGFARSLGRNRVVVSENSPIITPLKRVYNGRFNFNFDISPIEALPQDILLHVLCGVDHDDLKQLFHVSKTIREAGLIPAMQEVMSGVPHRFCILHLWKNFTKQWKDKELKGLVWQCARATNPTQFNRLMDRVKRLSVPA